MSLHGRLMPRFQRLPVVTRLVLAVAITMSLVLAGAAGLVYWRVRTALDQQLNDDLTTCQRSLDRAVRNQAQLPPGPRCSLQQVLDAHGRVLNSSDSLRHQVLLTAAEVDSVARGATIRRDVGSLLPITSYPLRLQATRVTAGGHRRIVITAVRRGHRDEALRELLAQLAIASGLTLIAASYVGYRTARAALRPVERYRSGAATLADGTQHLRLDVPADRDDEITRLGHTLNHMLDRLEASAERERRFVADASHELRTPLTLMRAELDVALHRPRSAGELTETLRSVDAEVQRLIDLANALLDLEELGSTGHITRAPAHLADLLDAAVAPHLRTAEQTGRAVTVDTDRVIVDVDVRWLQPAIRNLVDNALRHGHGTVRVTATVHESVLSMCVTDEGPGFPPEFLPRAFNRFARAEPSRTSDGSGLGLAFVYAVATAHGGTAHAHNATQGAAVTLRLLC
ncbi:sensor histidine kinase [Streptomyces brasiliensis]|uniref:histidine kinase n=1 Tax=Streptomyces brasiliensis TaxID=1954 RepID=A0A917KMF2_9ACTN|nr:HAMP domain-containing sensor histidine kinase [Streptomyces brasiliensis]GGJ18917.1 two-component sensor histidine kinase [Streptomyces brasiliensis]